MEVPHVGLSFLFHIAHMFQPACFPIRNGRAVLWRGHHVLRDYFVPRRTEKDSHCFFNASCFLYIPHDIRPLVKYQVNRVVRFYRVGDSVMRQFLFLCKSTENPVPDNKSGTVIFIQVLFVGSVMQPVVRGRSENIFDRGRKLLDVLGMDPELIKPRHLMADKKNKGVESDHDHRNEKDKLDMLGPAEPERYRKVIFFRIVVSHMGCPPEALFMGYPVCPITDQIQQNKTGDKRPPSGRNFPRYQVPEKKHGSKNDYLE